MNGFDGTVHVVWDCDCADAAAYLEVTDDDPFPSAPGFPVCVHVEHHCDYPYQPGYGPTTCPF